MTLIETIGALAFVYALLSIMASAIKEMIEARLQTRKRDLKGAIEDLLGVSGANKLLQHAAISALSNASAAAGRLSGRDVHLQWPSYIEPVAFAKAATDLLHDPTLASMLGNTKLGRLMASVEGDMQAKIAAVQDIYGQRMDRMVGSFKRNAQWWLLGIGLVLALVLDADTLRLARTLGADATQRAVLIAMVEKNASVEGFQANCLALNPGAQNAPLLDCVQDNLSGVLGWTGAEYRRMSSGAWWFMALHGLLKIIGYAITALAISMGAPFWFDLLNRVANLRSTLKPPPSPPPAPLPPETATVAVIQSSTQ